MEQIPVVIVSHKRAGKVLTHKHVSKCLLTCEERQVPAYSAAHPELADRIVAHPDDLSLMATWQWVMKKWPSHFWLDDDLLGVYRIYRRPGSMKKAVLSRDRAYDVIQHVADVAKQMGAHLFGFGKHAHPVTFDGLRPFRMGGYSPGGAYGLLEGHKLWGPDDEVIVCGSDHWLCLMNAFHHRYAWYDCRFAAGFFGTYQSAGGAAENRGTRFDGVEAEVAATEYLKKAFGSEAVVDSEYNENSIVTKRGRNAGRRQIVMPYHV